MLLQQEEPGDNSLLSDVDWEALFVPSTPVLEIVLRGSIMYIALFLLLRLVLKRESGGVGVTDLLVVVLIADASQNALAGDYESIPDGVLLVGVILFWAFAINWLGYHLPVVGRVVHPQPLELVRDGQLVRANMRKELVTRDELMTQLREQGVDDLAKVRRACMEGNGQISVITIDGAEDSRGVRKQVT